MDVKNTANPSTSGKSVAVPVEHLIGQAKKAEQFVINEFGSLRADQLNWTNHPERWSIAQCLDHLVVSDSLYYPVFAQILEGTYKMSFWQRRSPLSKMFGKLLINQMQETATRKFKSPKAFQPNLTTSGTDIIFRFGKHQDELINYMQELDKKDQLHVVISSPASSFVTYSIADAFQIIIKHQYRHLNQAARMKVEDGFPQ